MNDAYLFLFMVILMVSFLIIQVLLGYALRELFRDLKHFRQEMNEEMKVLIGQIANMSTAQGHICKILDGMVQYTLPTSRQAFPKDDGR